MPMFKQLNCPSISSLHPLSPFNPLAPSLEKFSTKGRQRLRFFKICHLKKKYIHLIPSHFRLQAKIKIHNHFNLTEGNIPTGRSASTFCLAPAIYHISCYTFPCASSCNCIVNQARKLIWVKKIT